jgi:hypothetical protein
MEFIDVVRLNLLSPMVLAFVLGVIAVLVKSNLHIPEQVYDVISIYLLFAIGLKGGFDLAKSSQAGLAGALLVAVVVGALIPLWSWWVLTRLGKFKDADAVALGIHYGGVSAVTLSACVTFLAQIGEPSEGFMPTMYVFIELPAVIVGLMLANARLSGANRLKLGELVRSAFTGKSFLLLGGGLIIGLVSGEMGQKQVAPFFYDLFSGFLTLFLLEMGTLVGKRLKDLRQVGFFLVGFGVIMPILHGALGVVLSSLVGLSVGGSMLMGAMLASASYITAPAIAQTNIPQANPSYYLTASLVITFPFNIIFGLPLFYQMALWLA